MRHRTHEGFLRHKGFRWAQIATGLCVAAVGVYFFAAMRLAEPPSGGSWLGYVLGTVSAGPFAIDEHRLTEMISRVMGGPKVSTLVH